VHTIRFDIDVFRIFLSVVFVPLLGWLSRNESWVTFLFLDAASLSGDRYT
jgi:hypothetical protein